MIPEELKALEDYYAEYPESERDIDAEYRHHMANLRSGSIQYHGAPRCRCGSRGTRTIGQSALMRMCLTCGRTFVYRLHDGHLIPLGLETAQAWDEERAR